MIEFDYLSILLQFVGGLGLFIFGMSTMADGLQKAAGPKLRDLIESFTKTKFLGVIVGAVVTAIIHSSSATTVMVVGFVNAGLMNLTQSVGVIMGANIGTTITSWMVASLEWFGGNASSFVQMLSPEFYAPIAVFIGVFISFFSKKSKTQQIGEIIAGFGMLFFGMTIMSAGVAPLADSPMFQRAFIELGRNPLLGLLAGVLITGVIQSSAASVGILQSLALIGLVPWSAAIYIIMGQNIGTCVTALLSSIGASKTARAASIIHLMFNVIGSVLFTIISVILLNFFFVELANSPISSTQISMAHTAFNILNTIILYPFSNQLVSISKRIVGLKETDSEVEERFLHLDDRLLETPAAAISSLIKEITRMGVLAEENIQLSIDGLLEHDEEKIASVRIIEKQVNELNHGISDFLVKLSNHERSEIENKEITSMFHIINDIERISDHCDNIANLALEAIEADIIFSAIAVEEVKEIADMTMSCVAYSIHSLTNRSVEDAEKALALESEMDKLEATYRQYHIDRLTNNECSVENGVIFIDTLSNLERMSDHAKNVAQAVLSVFVSPSEQILT